MKHIAVILAGCGSKDGSEIHEATLALYYICKKGLQYTIFAPEMQQNSVVDHFNGIETIDQKRDVLIESARIARGDIQPLSQLDVSMFDALVLPGGFGAAKNLFTYAYDGFDFNVIPQLENIIVEFHKSGKPICAMCIAPVMIAKVLGKYAVEITVGKKGELSEGLEKHFGAKTLEIEPTGVCIDTKNRVLSTPSYMYDTSTIKEIGLGADNMIESLIKLIN